MEIDTLEDALIAEKLVLQLVEGMLIRKRS
jgi:hypothetical protein